MKRSIQVYLGKHAQLLGNLHYNLQGNRESSAFEYDPTWLESSDSFQIDPALRLIVGPQFRQKSKDGSPFWGAIADCEPDGWARRVILRDRAKRRSVERESGSDRKEMSALDFLLEIDDESRLGALRFCDEAGIFQKSPEPNQRRNPPLIELSMLLSATKALETNQETAADLAYLKGRGTSLGGMRPKCTLIDDDGSLAIGKFPSVQDERDVTKGEVLALRLAQKAGINAAQAKLVESEGQSVAVIKRFDRSISGERIPYVSAATMLSVGQDAIQSSYLELVDVIRLKGASSKTDIEELWRRIAFSILITNVDDHLHNQGFLHTKAELWRLSPAFDINPFPEKVRELKTWISEDTGPSASIAALMSVREYFQISKSRAKEILNDVNAAVSQWESVGKTLGFKRRELEAFADAFEHKEREEVRKCL